MSISYIRTCTHQRTNIIHKNVWRLLLLLNLVPRMDRSIEKLMSNVTICVASTMSYSYGYGYGVRPYSRRRVSNRESTGNLTRVAPRYFLVISQK